MDERNQKKKKGAACTAPETGLTRLSSALLKTKSIWHA